MDLKQVRFPSYWETRLFVLLRNLSSDGNYENNNVQTQKINRVTQQLTPTKLREGM